MSERINDKYFKALFTIAIPLLVLIVVVFGYHGIMTLDIHSLANSIVAGVLIPIVKSARKLVS